MSYAVPGDDPDRVADPAGLIRALDRLRRRAAGPASQRVGLDTLTRRTGIPRSSLHAYLSGASLPPAGRLHAIVVALGADSTQARAWSDALDRILDDRLRRRTQPASVASGGRGPNVLAVFACVTVVDTPVYTEPHPASPQSGLLRAGNSWVVHQRRGEVAPAAAGAQPTDIWLYTQGDDPGGARQGWGWIPASVVRDAVAYQPLPGVPWAGSPARRPPSGQ